MRLAQAEGQTFRARTAFYAATLTPTRIPRKPLMYIENHLTFAREQLGTERGYCYNDEKTDTFLLMLSTALASTVLSPASYFSAYDVIDTIDISGRIEKMLRFKTQR